MSFEEFQISESVPTELPGALQALWHDSHGNWRHAHELVQDDSSMDGAWVHAYLHRKEGDLANASYWYRQANRSVSHDTLQHEWRDMVIELLEAMNK